MIQDYFSLALRNIFKRGLRSWLTMIGIFIGIAAVVGLIGLGEGLRIAISAQFGFLGTDVLSIQASGLNFAGPPGFAVPDPLSDELAEKIKKLPGIEASFNRHIASGKIEWNNIQEIGYVGSVPIGEDRRRFEEMVNLNLIQGRMLKDGDGRKVVLGNDFAKEDNAYKKSIGVGDNILINNEKYQVVGVLEKKGSFTLDSIVFMNEDTMLDNVKKDDGTTNIIAARVSDVNEIDNVKIEIEKLMRKERHVKVGEENFIVETPQSILNTLNSALSAVQIFVTIIAIVSLVVGGIGIMNTMFTAVIERTREIGVMKAIGAKNSAIFSIFFIESGLLGSVGGLAGVVGGLVFSYGFALIGRIALGSNLIQAQVSPILILGSIAFSFLIGTVFGSWPAYQASQMNPVDSLKGGTLK